MADLFSCQTFPGFGLNALEDSADSPPITLVSAERGSALRAHIRRECPRRPGVYGMLDCQGEVIYIGKAKCLRARLLSYFRAKSRDPKAGRIVAAARAIAWETAPNEFAALLRELELIRRWRPHFNVLGKPKRQRRCYVCLGRRPAPYAFTAVNPPAGAVACFGPVPSGERVREAVRRLNDWFGLRDCPQAQAMVFAGQAELFPEARTPGCLRHEIGTCLAPCAAACTREAYMARVRAARAFLAGTDVRLLETLEQTMTAASEALDYERAALLRDRLECLRWLTEQLERLRRACESQAFIYPVTHDGHEHWYLIRGGRVVAALPAPNDAPSRRRAEALITEVYDSQSRNFGLPGVEEMDRVFLVASWFRSRPAERERTLEPAVALARCRGITGS